MPPCVIPRVQVLKTLEEFERITEAAPVKLSSRSPCDLPLRERGYGPAVPAQASYASRQGVLCEEVAFRLPEELHSSQGDHRDQLRLAASALLRKVLRIRMQSIARSTWLTEAEVIPPVTAA
jgi:hypothetical protein